MKLDRWIVSTKVCWPLVQMDRPSVPQASPFIASEAPTSFLGVTDEYDPLHPNDYEDVVARRREQRQREREEERRKEAEERR